ncbi:hypothetical protein NAI62_12350, partial [Francisella tularensis subsp. holarctica]|nr:hypothetical protein [Francisella tularensis subsp. holarctica]
NNMLLQASMLCGMDGGDAAFIIANIAIMAATGDYFFAVIGFVNLLLGFLGPDQQDIVRMFSEKSLQDLTDAVTAQID